MWKKLCVLFVLLVLCVTGQIVINVSTEMNASQLSTLSNPLGTSSKVGDVITFGGVEWFIIDNSDMSAVQLLSKRAWESTVGIGSTKNGTENAVTNQNAYFATFKDALTTRETNSLVTKPYYPAKSEVDYLPISITMEGNYWPTTTVADANNLWGCDRDGIFQPAYLANATPGLMQGRMNRFIMVVKGLEITFTPTDKSMVYKGKKGDVSYSGEGSQIGSGSTTGFQTSLSLSLVKDEKVVGSDTDFQNFSIDAKADGTYNLMVSSSGPDIVDGSLCAKTYKFAIRGLDGDGNDLVVPVSITIGKANANLAFVDKENITVKVGDAATEHTISHDNSDDVNGSVISYDVQNGLSGILQVNKVADNGKAFTTNALDTPSSSSLPLTYTLKATAAETDNYLSSTVSKEVFVYKALSDISITLEKNEFATSDVNKANVTVANAGAVDGVQNFTYTLATHPSDSTKSADNSSFTISGANLGKNVKAVIKTKNGLVAKDYHLTIKVVDNQGDSFYKEVVISVKSQPQPAINFKDRKGGNIISQKSIKYDDSNIKLIAEGGASDNTNEIEYAYAPDDMQGGRSPSDYLSINKSDGLLTPKRTGTIKVQAKRPGNAAYDDVVVYMDLTIEAAEQTITFNDTSSIVNIKEGASKKVDATGTIKNSGLTGIGPIIYSIDDPTIATIDSSTGDVTGIKAGTVTLTATMNKTGETGYNSNYDTVTATKPIKIYTGMSIIWSASSPKLKANANAVGNKAGTLSVTDNASDPSFAISSKSTVENTDASFFKVVDNGTTADVQLAKTISASDWESHGGSFKVQVDVTDSNGTQTTDVVITLDEADNDVYFTEGGVKITALTKTYGENNNTFTLTSKTNGKGVTYSVVTDPDGVLTVLGTGAVTINKAGSATVQVLAGAGNGYAQKTVTMVVTIDTGDQSIAFNDTATLNRPFVLNSTFSETAELKETSIDTVSSRNITYTSNDTAVCDVDSITGIVTMKTIGNCDITASNSDANWTEVTTNKVINLYDGMGVSFTQTPSLQAEVTSTNAGAKAGSLTVSGGIDPKTYAISTATGAKNRDAAKFQVNSSGIVSFKTSIMASDLVGKYNTAKKIYEYYVQIETTDSLNTKVTTDAIVEIKGAPLKASFDTKGTGKITEVYGAGRTFTLDLSSNKGGGNPTYQIKNDANMPSDVLQSVDASGLVTILHANDKTFVGNPLKVEAIIPPSNGYDGETIETEVEITQATQPDFAFVTPNIKLGHGASITPTFTGQLASGTISMTSGNNALATINGNDIKAKTTDGTVTITAIESGDRDYKRTTSTATVTVSSAPAYDLVLNVPSATYGDTGLTATVILNDATGGNQAQTWSSSDPSIAEIAQGTQLDESGVITIHKAGTVTISCTQTSTGEPSVTATAIFVIDPKPITVAIDNASKYVGEAVANFHATISTSDLVGSDTIGQPVFSCKDGSALVDANTKAGKYDINATYPTGSNPNYAITIIKGELTIKQDASQADWYHLEGATSTTTLNPNDWHKEDVKVVLDSAIESAGTYDEISLDNTLWDASSITVSDEGENIKDITFRIKSSGSVSTSQATTIKIDKVKPIIKSISGTQTNKDAISQLINKVTFGTFFKPGTKVSIQSEDMLPTSTTKVSGVEDITYNVYEIDKTLGLINPVAIDNGTLVPDASGKIEVTLNDIGLYRVCALAKDNAGNESVESCSDLNVKKIDFDVDKDGTLDFNDPDEDGCPDINIVWKNADETWTKLNVDIDNDQQPELNIDSEGKTAGSPPDGIADINIDTDDDKIADLNIVDIETWNPKICVSGQVEEYCTDNTPIPNRNIDFNGDGRPDINIDLDDDGIPDIDIDTDGDGERDINIDNNQDGTPDEKLKEMKEWILDEKVFEVSGKKFHTMTGLIEDNIDHLEDGGVVAKPGEGQIFLPNYALKVTDKTQELDEKTKNSIQGMEPDKAFKQYLKIDLTKDNVVIQPDGKVSISIPIDQAIKNPKVMIEQADGTFVEVTGTLKDGVFTYETTFVGGVVVFGDNTIEEESKQPDPVSPDLPTQKKPDTSVKGNYVGGMGGAGTGDATNNGMLLIGVILSVATLFFLTYKRRKEE